ncbi:hypothetical protein YC2023_086773 [Brassica napus]
MPLPLLPPNLAANKMIINLGGKFHEIDSVQSFSDHAVKSIQHRFNSLLLSSSSPYGTIQVN